MQNDLVAHVEGAIRRLSADGASSDHGSHAAGIFNKAADSFEKRIAAFTASVTGRSNLDKKTLGALIQILEESPHEHTHEGVNHALFESGNHTEIVAQQ